MPATAQAKNVATGHVVPKITTNPGTNATDKSFTFHPRDYDYDIEANKANATPFIVDATLANSIRTPRIITPVNNARGVTKPILFDWSSITNADHYRISGSTNLGPSQISVRDDESWLTTSLGDSTPGASYSTNTGSSPRTAAIAVAGGGLARTVTVARDGSSACSNATLTSNRGSFNDGSGSSNYGGAPSITISPSSQEVPASAGSTTFTVETKNISSLVSGATLSAMATPSSWLLLELAELSGSGSTRTRTLTANYSANTGSSSRTATITVSYASGLIPQLGDSAEDMVTVVQAGADPILSVDGLLRRDVPSSLGITTFTVSTNLDTSQISVNDNATWLTTSLSGSVLRANYNPNTGSSPRTATITVSGGGLTEMLRVVQAGSASCGDATLNSNSGSFRVGRGNSYYRNNSSCSWRIDVPSGKIITLNFSSFDTESMYDVVKVYDGNSSSSDLLGSFSGSSVPPSVVSSGDRMYVTFTTDEGTTRPGWSANYTSSPAPSLSLSPSSRNVSSSRSSTTFTVNTNLSSSQIRVSKDATWLTINLRGSVLRANYSANTGSSQRTATITVSGGGLTETVTVVQAGTAVASFLSLNPLGKDVLSPASSTTFTVSTNLSHSQITVNDNATWLTTGLSVDTRTLTATYSSNTGSSPRTATITVSGGGLARTVTVVQAGTAVASFLSLNPLGKDVLSPASSTTFTVSTNLSHSQITVNDNATWLTTGLSVDTRTLTANYSSNTGSSPRTATITVSGGGLARTVTVVQAGSAACGNATLTSSSGSFNDGSGSSNYGNNLWCSWLIDVLSGRIITLNFSSFDTESMYDVVSVYDGNSSSSPLLGSFSGSSVPSSVVSSGDRMYVRFTTDGSETRRGWSATYTSSTPSTPSAPSLSLDPSRRNVTASEDNTTFSVSTNLSSSQISVSDNKSWLTTSLSGSVLTANYDSNTGSSQRTATITVRGGGLTETVTVEQAGKINPPTIITPANNARGVATPIRFGWSSIPNADNYRISVATSRTGFDPGRNPMFPNSVLNTATGTTPRYTWSGATPGTTYYWAVRVSVPGQIATTEIYEFTVASTSNPPLSLSPPTIATPVNNARGVATPIRFDWSSIPNADNYRISVATSRTGFDPGRNPMFPNSVLNTATGTTSEYTWNDATPGTTYYWAVRVSVPGNTATTAIHKFTVASTSNHTLSLSPSRREVPASRGSTTFSVNTSLSSSRISVRDDARWLNTSLSGSTLSATYSSNTGRRSRTATITVSGGGVTRTVTVEQAGTRDDVVAPDYIVEDIQIINSGGREVSKVTEGDEVKIKAIIKNIGNEEGRARIKYYANNSRFDTDETSSIDVNETDDETSAWFLVPNTDSLHVKVVIRGSKAGSVEERNDSNNERTVTIPVSRSTASTDHFVLKITTTAGTNSSDRSFTFYTQDTNYDIDWNNDQTFEECRYRRFWKPVPYLPHSRSTHHQV